MANECCLLVGNFPITQKGIISISVTSSTETSKIGDNLIIGATIGTVSISGFAQDIIHNGCPGKAGVQIPWIKKWDCDNNEIYFIPAGEGRSFISGDVNNLATLGELVLSYNTINASASSGPTSIYMDTNQEDGYGLSYTGSPINFVTSEEGVTCDGIIDVGLGKLYLQSFNLECNPGAIPMASYSFVFVGLSAEV